MLHICIILFAIAVGVAFIAEKVKQPYPTLLVIAGLVLGLLPIESLEEVKGFITNDKVFKDTIILLFLSALLGDASLKLPFHELKENKKPILLLAFIGTFLTFLLVSALTYFVLDLPLQHALIFGALMSATDPVSVLSIFKSMGLNKRLSVIVEGESLANDGVAVVLYKIALVTTVVTLSGVSHGALEFLKVVAGGLIVGVVFGFLSSRLTSKIDHHLIEIGLSIVVFYGAYVTAEHYHLSGVIAVVVAGLILGNYGKKIGMSENTLDKIDSFWESIAFIANAVIFLMIGLEISRIGFEGKWGVIAGSIIIVVLSRFVAVFISLLFDKTVPNSWKTIMSWGGLKGSLSIALILSISPDFAGRDLLLSLTFSNVMFSLLVQGTTIPLLVKWLKIK
ncbi:sodium:proton antiporter [Bacillus sp. M6-12]|uniref:cation:proton antiporter n=1 Tax=Bacillus sp. M6-12 TaxID=2054166 RepID=UPI000C78D9AC|nr:cation:proton antiporter [Bacillus sp. M6-12]PLS19189.1 sodium:proton antiporter [Bacillus sp. M6-12]